MQTLSSRRPCGRRRGLAPAVAMVMLFAALSALILVCQAAPIRVMDEEPWRLQSNQERDAKLTAELTALKDAGDAEAQAAAREKAVGSATLEKADEETHQATKFMTRAERLLASEQALKDEQEKVQEKLNLLESEHQNIHGWAACRGQGCSADSRDEWAVSDDSPLAPSQSARSASRGRDEDTESAEERKQQVLQRLKSHKHSSKKKKSKEPEAKAFDPGPQGKPYSMDGWVDTKPTVNWEALKGGALKAGYDLTNCMVAAEKDKSTVEVRIMRMGKAIMTRKGCTCLSPWSVYREHGASSGHLEESKQLTTYGGDGIRNAKPYLCSKNGSSRSWCAVWGDSCGHESTDPHAGHGEGQYGWTHWDYCDVKKKRWHWLDKWESVHSAGEVTCAADFLLASDRAAEWRALELLRQEEAADPKDQLPPAEVASRYTKCITRAERGDSAVFCEADMLRHLPPSVVRHALLISRSRDVDVHWLNRQRVVVLYAEQLQGCMAAAEGVKEGVLCIAQLLSSLPHKPADLAVQNALDAGEGGEAPEEVSELSARLVGCVRDAIDDDAIAFCVSNFLARAPAKTVQLAAHMAHRTRSFGTAGFTDIKGEAHVGWAGFEDSEQAHGKHIWSQPDAK